MSDYYKRFFILIFLLIGGLFSVNAQETINEYSGEQEEDQTDDHPLTAENRFDLDGFNASAISFYVMFSGRGGGGGVTITIFEQYKPNAFFNLSYFLSGSISGNSLDNQTYYNLYTIGAGVLFKHRFPGNRFIWNLGASLEFLMVFGNKEVSFDYYDYDNHGDYYTGTSYINTRNTTYLMGMGIQTGFSFRFNPYTSLELNGFAKIPFGLADKEPYSQSMDSDKFEKRISDPESISFWPFTGGIQLGMTFWIPYRSRR